MKRELKFRAWEQNNKIMAYPERHIVMTDNEGYSHLEQLFDIDKRTSLASDDWDVAKDGKKPCILMQFTGLKDKNGKEIYEGDLFEVAGNKVYQIKYSEGGESNHEWYGGAFLLWLNEETFFPFDEYAMKHGKVIGNIYENPIEQ